MSVALRRPDSLLILFRFSYQNINCLLFYAVASLPLIVLLWHWVVAFVTVKVVIHVLLHLRLRSPWPWNYVPEFLQVKCVYQDAYIAFIQTSRQTRRRWSTCSLGDRSLCAGWLSVNLDLCRGVRSASPWSFRCPFRLRRIIRSWSCCAHPSAVRDSWVRATAGSHWVLRGGWSRATRRRRWRRPVRSLGLVRWSVAWNAWKGTTKFRVVDTLECSEQIQIGF